MKNSIDSGGGSVPPLANGQRRPEVEEELRRWYAMDETKQQESLRAGMQGCHVFSIETLVHLSRRAYTNGDREFLNLAFETFSIRATPLLLSQAWGLPHDERQGQAQEVMLYVFNAIRTGKADFVEINFAAFAFRKAVSLYRKRKIRFENITQRIEATDEFDPVDKLPAPTSSAEEQVLLDCLLDKLPAKHRDVVIQYYRLEMTQEEIASHHEVTVRTVHNWLRAAEAELGLRKGGNMTASQGRHPSLDDILAEIATSATPPDAQQFRNWVSRYPQFKAEIVDFVTDWIELEATKLPREVTQDEVDLVVNRTMSRLQQILDESEWPTSIRNLRAELEEAGHDLDSFQRALGIDRSILSCLMGHMIQPATVPLRLVNAMAQTLNRNAELVRDYLRQPLQQTAVAYSASRRPVPTQREFAVIIRQSGLSEAEKERWLSEPADPDLGLA